MSGPRVAINAQLSPGGGAGGVEQFLTSLVQALGRLQDGPEEYVLVVPREHPDWLNSHMGSNQKTVLSPAPVHARDRLEPVKRLLGPLRGPAGKAWLRARRLVVTSRSSPLLELPQSNGFYESLGVDLVHFPFQYFAACDLPTIFNPHDLQHLHYPQFFTADQIAWRELIYPAGCRLSRAVAAESNSTRTDVIDHYGIEPGRVYTIPRGAPTQLYEPVTETIRNEVKQRFHLKEPFCLYPAQTWPHKNHIRLLQALALIRDRDGTVANLICTGKKNDFWPEIEEQIRESNLNDDQQVCFLGYVEPSELRALYSLAQFVVFPSLFEGGGFPLLEAFGEGTPVACSHVTSLPEYGGDAALYFDPSSVESIAEAVKRMSTDASLRSRLRQFGTARISLFNWERTARTYRALYRMVAGQAVAEEDRSLLTNTPELQKSLETTEAG